MAHKSLQEQISELLKNKQKLENLKFDNGKTLKAVTEDVLVDEAKKLRDCIQERIDEYYKWYTPTTYKRTKGLKRALDSNKFKIEIDGDTKFIRISFNDELSYGKSKLENGEDGYKPMLIDKGWKSPLDKPHFLGYEGFDIIDDAIKDWEANLEYDITVDKSGWIYE